MISVGDDTLLLRINISQWNVQRTRKYMAPHRWDSWLTSLRLGLLSLASPDKLDGIRPEDFLYAAITSYADYPAHSHRPYFKLRLYMPTHYRASPDQAMHPVYVRSTGTDMTIFVESWTHPLL